MITYSVRFETADQADRAAARLRSRGIPLQQYLSSPAKQSREPGLVVATPYGYPSSLASPSYATGLLNGLPQTDGNAVIYPLPFSARSKETRVDARFTVMDRDADRTRRVLINCGGARMRVVQ